MRAIKGSAAQRGVSFKACTMRSVPTLTRTARASNSMHRSLCSAKRYVHCP